MKTHAEIGAKLLDGDDSALMCMARQIALSHHEKWDGTGYPNGLQGEEIPLVGRIAAVADVFDALTSVRPYKHAWSIESASDYLKENRGRHFCPQLVDAFFDIFPKIIEIKQAYSD